MNKTGPTRLRDVQRRALALVLRRGGNSYAAIAAHEGPDGKPLFSSRQAANRSVLRALREIGRENAEVVLGLELDRLDAVHRGLWPAATRGEPLACPDCGTVVAHDPSIPAVNAVLRVSERRAALLGLDHRDQTEERAVAVLEAQAQLTDRAVREGLARAGIPDATIDQALQHIGDVLRALDEAERQPDL